MNTTSIYQDIRSVLFPERRWQYVFHLIVLLFSSAYWIGSYAKLPDSSMAEMVMYRPDGDTELYSAITALSRLNFGEIQDAGTYGHGLTSFPVISLAPHALAYAAMGKAGYVVADVLFPWAFFVVVAVFLRQCNLCAFSSLVIGSGLATNAFQAFAAKSGEFLTHLLNFLKLPVSENDFPNLLELSIYGRRIHRPMVTEIFLVALLYLLLKLWREHRMPSLRRGVVVGALFALLVQGDLFSTAITGLLLALFIVWLIVADGWRIPWRFLGGISLGGILFGWVFLLQRLHENPDCVRRMGMATYPRLHLLFLPGYAPLLQVGIIVILAGAVYFGARRRERSGSQESLNLSKKKPVPNFRNKKINAGAPPLPDTSGTQFAFLRGMAVEQKIAVFFSILIVVAFIAQPFQIFLLGKGVEIYHYLLAMPSFYSYALIVLLANLVMLAIPDGARESMREIAVRPGMVGALLLTLLFTVEALAAVDSPLTRVNYLQNPRGADGEYEPWGLAGIYYRPNLRALEKEFLHEPALKQTRTFSTLCLDVNLMLTAFYDKKAFNPYLGGTILSDDAVENRLCEFARITGVKPEAFGLFVKQTYMLNYWLGANKYRFATDHKFSADSDYPPEDIEFSKHMPKQWGWILRLPNSERDRLSGKYSESLAKKTDSAHYPDTIILTAFERNMGLLPSPEYYREFYTNQVFYVYLNLKSEVQKGDAQAQLQLGKHYLNGEGVPVNLTNAFQCFLKAAEQGLAEAQCQVGVRYFQGEGVARDFAASIAWFRKAAAQGSIDAQYNLGLLYENGLGVNRDIAQATAWYQRAGENGHILAQNSLGLICFNLKKDYAAAAQWFQRSAELGNALAQNSLGVLYLNGLGVKQDANEALKWFQLSGQNGLAEGQNNCGLVYFRGQRLSDSAQWFHKAADQGHAGAQCNLAQFFQKGLVYRQDLDEAMLWYSRSAKQGYGPAQLALGQIYHEGQGVKVDNNEAYKWLKLAQLQGTPDANKALTNCAAAMSGEQVTAAENELKELLKQK